MPDTIIGLACLGVAISAWVSGYLAGRISRSPRQSFHDHSN